MSLVQTHTEIEYPETDGKPLGETDLHRQWMTRIHDLLSYHYRGRQVYVGCNLLVYYDEGNPHQFVVPDNFVVTDCDPGPRRVFKIWEEGKSPQVVIEVTSRATRTEDLVYKPQLYARIGVAEYFLYDRTSDYLQPPLQGFRLDGGQHVPIEPDQSGALECRELHLRLKLDQGQLVMIDAETNRPLLTEAEAERAAREAAEARVAVAEEELTRLRERLQQHGVDDAS